MALTFALGFVLGAVAVVAIVVLLAWISSDAGWRSAGPGDMPDGQP